MTVNTEMAKRAGLVDCGASLAPSASWHKEVYKPTEEFKTKPEIVPQNALKCLFCVKREFCKVICPEVEDLLPKPRSGGHKKEINIDPTKMDNLDFQGIIVSGIIVRGRHKGELGGIIVSRGKRKTAQKGLYSEGYIT